MIQKFAGYRKSVRMTARLNATAGAHLLPPIT
jgi:hypothetical protein